MKGAERMRRADKEILKHDSEERAAVGGVSSLHGRVQANGGNDKEPEA